MSPKRDKKATQKPRKDWLVAVGRGLSPSSTMSGQDIAARKKVDAENLSFRGLEQEVNNSGAWNQIRKRFSVRSASHSGGTPQHVVLI